MGKIEEFLKIELGSGSGSGDGSGDGSGSGSGSGSGDGSGDGSGSGDGYGSGSGYGYGDGYGSGSGYGYGDGYGYGYGSGIKSFKGKTVYAVDGVSTIIERVRNNVAKGFILNGDFTLTPCFIVKAQNCFAHGETLKEAQEALEEKLFEDMDIDEKIRLFIEKFSLDKEYPAKDFYDWHNKLTGSCEMGRKAFAKDHGIDVDNDQMTVEDFIGLTKNSFGSSVIKQLAQELKMET